MYEDIGGYYAEEKMRQKKRLNLAARLKYGM